MRPGVRGEEFEVLVEAAAQVGAEAVVDGTPVGVVGVHVAEGNAAGVSAGKGSTGCIESLAGQAGFHLFSEAHTGASSGEEYGLGDGRIQTAGTEKVHQRGTHPGAKWAVTAGRALRYPP